MTPGPWTSIVQNASDLAMTVNLGYSNSSLNSDDKLLYLLRPVKCFLLLNLLKYFKSFLPHVFTRTKNGQLHVYIIYNHVT